MKKFTSEEIVRIALESGASLAGVANIEDLKKAPAFNVVTKMPEYNGVGTYMRDENDTFLPGVVWPEGMKSVVVLAYYHPVNEPKLDYWFDGHTTPGNRKLMEVNKKFKEIMIEAGIETYPLHYHIEKGGIFLKDSAVVAGLGCIGRNNLLVTPQYGSHVRLRGIGLNLDLQSTGPSGYDPCAGCEVRCWEKCSKGVFAKKVYSEEKLGRAELPGRVGNFDRTICNIQMKEDEANMEPMELYENSEEGPINAIKYCRVCECACPIGK
ncbi:hypothetical protein [Clostridium thailandense]|uniref:hypothetical protein n=1 Tax=Clostridium thailandense TaxID=2794346 RepID=UPI003988EE45